MPSRNRKDVSDDLKRVIVSGVASGKSYHDIAAVTGVSVGAIAAIMKVTTYLLLGGRKAENSILQLISIIYFCFLLQ